MRTVILLLLGLSVGSFLNVLIDRIPKNVSIGGRSKCDNCKKTLGALELFPVLSYVYLGGKCRYCKARISFRNPVVEVATATLFVLTYLYVSPFDLYLLYYLFIISCFIAIFFIDLKEQIIPDKITYPAILVTLLFLIFNENLIFVHLLTSFFSFLFFLLLYLGTRGRGMGFGDAKLALLIGLFLGYPKAIVAIYAAFLTGALYSVILILWREKTLKDKVAFGPFLVIGTLLSLFLGEKMVSLWLNFL